MGRPITTAVKMNSPTENAIRLENRFGSVHPVVRFVLGVGGRGEGNGGEVEEGEKGEGRERREGGRRGEKGEGSDSVVKSSSITAVCPPRTGIRKKEAAAVSYV